MVLPEPDFSRAFVIEHDDVIQTIHILDLFHSDTRTESNQYDIVYKIILDNDYRRLLSAAGFEDVHIYGDYEMNDYTVESRRLIVVARRTD